ncbi:DUF922 domain-containing protein [Salinimicrobium sp. GXAS 041]|uniref:DUF922 domain-containing protein n=1 Tax=Salinimicrobium sp. GXAS 041 TaxID=3400806 RepID=UPI003C742A07
MYRIFFFLFLFSGFNSFSQNAEVKMPWSAEMPLSWENFEATPDENNRFSAMTNTGIAYSWSLKSFMGKNDFQYEVQSNFYPGNSWVKPDKKDAYLLAHEQLHFDISELHARKLRKALEEYKLTKNVKQDLQKIYKAIELQRHEMQQKFDLESRHSTQKEAEDKWQKFVRSELEKYEDFAL